MNDIRYAKYAIRDNRGVVLVMTFMIMVSVIAVTVAFLSLMSVRMKNAGYDLASHKALWIAEAGLQDVIYRLGADPVYAANPTAVTGSLGDGSYSVTVSLDGGTYSLVSTGSVDVIDRQISRSMTVSSFYDHVLYAGGSINTGSATNLTVTGTQLTGATDFPAIDLSYYQLNASPGQDISGNYTFTAGVYSGIWYVSGNVTIESNVTINGTLVTAKKITGTRESNITINPSSNNAALMANDSITLSRSTDITIDGFIYAGADGTGSVGLSRADTVDITGIIMAGSSIDLSRTNDATITYDASIADDPPPGVDAGGVILQNDWNEN